MARRKSQSRESALPEAPSTASPPRKGKAGRPPGRKNKATVRKELLAERGLRAALDAGITPLEVILGKMRGTLDVTDDQVAAAIAAAPYVHPKLSAVAFRDTTPPSDLIDLSQATAAELAALRKFIARSQQTVDHNPIDNEEDDKNA